MEISENRTNNLEVFYKEVESHVEDKIDQSAKKDLLSNITKTWNAVFNSNFIQENPNPIAISSQMMDALKLAAPPKKDRELGNFIPHFLELQKRSDFFYVSKEGAEAILKKQLFPYILRPSSSANSIAISINTQGQLMHARIEIDKNTGEYIYATREKNAERSRSIDTIIKNLHLPQFPLQYQDETNPKRIDDIKKNMTSREDFYDIRSQQQAEEILSQKELLYLIRPSSEDNALIITFKKNNQIFHHEIKINKLGQFKTYIEGDFVSYGSIERILYRFCLLDRREHSDPDDVRRRLDKNNDIAAKAVQPPRVPAQISGINPNTGQTEIRMLEPGQKWNMIPSEEVLKAIPASIEQGSLNAIGIGFAHLQGLRPTQEDRHFIEIFDVNVKGTLKTIKLAGILDGHGGIECAAFAAANMREKIEKIIPLYLEKYANEGEEVALYNALKIAFVDLTNDYEKARQLTTPAGSTICMIMGFNDQILIANAGDSRAILVKNGLEKGLTEDSRLEFERYKEQVEKRGGFISRGRVGGVAENARGLGDNHILGVTARPKLTILRKEVLQKFMQKEGGKGRIVVACDGLWDVASSEQVARTVTRLQDYPLEQISQVLTGKAYVCGSTDNISALIIDLEKFIR